MTDYLIKLLSKMLISKKVHNFLQTNLKRADPNGYAVKIVGLLPPAC